MEQHENFSNQSAEDVIKEFVCESPGLSGVFGEGHLKITQLSDGKVLDIQSQAVEEVLSRLDSNGKLFLQVNFLDGKKVLLTEKLVGFKPASTNGLDMSRLPKVVTTPDLVSVVEAIEESLSSEQMLPEEVEVLKKVFDSVLIGGEAIGFDLSDEREWVSRLLMHNRVSASA